MSSSSSDDSPLSDDSDSDDVGLKGLVTLSDESEDVSDLSSDSSSEEMLMDSDDDPFLSLSQANTKVDNEGEDDEFMTEYSVQIISESEEDDDGNSDDSELSDKEDANKTNFEQAKANSDIKKENEKGKRLKEMVTKLTKEFNYSPEVALEASKRCKTMDEAVKYSQQLALINGFIRMKLHENQALVAVELWSKKLVENKEEAAQVAKRCSSFQQAEKFVLKHKEKQKQMRKVQCEHDFSSCSEAEKLCELLKAGYSENESVKAIKDGGAVKAEEYIQLYRIQKDKRIRLMMSCHDLNREQSLVAIELMDLEKCDEKMACYLAKTSNMTGAKEQWKMLQKRMRNCKLLPFYELVNDTLKTGQHVSLAMDLAEMGYDWLEIIEVAESCDSVAGALAMLIKRCCAMCLENFTVKNMLSLFCGHEMCKDCGKRHFTNRIKEHSSVVAIVCPFPNCTCGNNDLDYEYFNFLQQLLKPLVDPDVFEIFENKLRDKAIENLPENFIWCPKCKSAFLLGPNLDKINCPECQHAMCAKCKTDWEPNHEGKTCAQVRDLEGDKSSEGVINDVLRQKGIECPNCNIKFELIQGGCMHLQCPGCQFEFCEGCTQQMFKKGVKCGGCNQDGLHAHHPRHCQYYLRDYGVAVLEDLFKLNEKEIPAILEDHAAADGKCQVVVQKSDDKNSEEKCGEDLFANQPTLCERHYKEHLCTHIRNLKLDPVSFMEPGQLEQELTRHKKDVPKKAEGEDEVAFKERLIQCVLDQVPSGSKY